MQTKKQFLKQFIIYISIVILGLILGGIVLLISHHSDINYFRFTTSTIILPTTTISYHPSISAIELYFKKGEFLNAYNEALKYNNEHPDDPASYKYLGYSLFQIGNYNESIKNCEIALQDKTLATSTKTEFYCLIAKNYVKLKNCKEALSYGQKAIELNPDYAPSYDIMGMCMIEEGRYKEAISFLEKELSLIPNAENSPQSAYPYYYLAKTYFILHDYIKAHQMIEIAQKLAQGIPEPKPTLFFQTIESLKSEIKRKLSQ